MFSIVVSVISLLRSTPWLLFAAVYAIALFAYFATSRREFKRSPEKGQRYAALPIGYKLACWFGVVPLFAAAAIHPALFLGAVVAFMMVESACVRWYRKSGWLPP